MILTILRTHAPALPDFAAMPSTFGRNRRLDLLGQWTAIRPDAAMAGDGGKKAQARSPERIRQAFLPSFEREGVAVATRYL